MTVTDQDAIDAREWMWDRFRLLIEHSAAVAVAAFLSGRVDIAGKRAASSCAVPTPLVKADDGPAESGRIAAGGGCQVPCSATDSTAAVIANSPAARSHMGWTRFETEPMAAATTASPSTAVWEGNVALA